MSIINKDILSKLKCSVCTLIISRPPVYSKKNAENICGRCAVKIDQRKNLFRNYLYEKIASDIIFSCAYENFGCNAKLKWNETEEHETSCKFGMVKKISCPTLPAGKCMWEGTEENIFDHFQSDHSDLIVTHPYTINKNLGWIITDRKNKVKKTFRNMVMKAHDYVFLLQFKVCFRIDTMWLSVTHIGNTNLSAHFQSLLEFDKERLFLDELFAFYNYKPAHYMQVLTEISPLQEKNAFKIPFRKNCQLSIQLNNVKCKNCKKTFSKLNQKEFCCKNWDFERNEKTESKIVGYRCDKFEKGCPYIGINENLLKHEKFFCNFSNIFCYLCGFHCKDFCLMDHLKQTHFINRFNNVIDLDIVRTNLSDTENFLLETNKGKFLCSCQFTKFYNLLFPIFTMIVCHVIVISDLPRDQDQNINFKIKFVHNLTELEVDEKLTNTIITKYGTSFRGWETFFEICPGILLESDSVVYSLKIEMIE